MALATVSATSAGGRQAGLLPSLRGVVAVLGAAGELVKTGRIEVVREVVCVHCGEPEREHDSGGGCRDEGRFELRKFEPREPTVLRVAGVPLAEGVEIGSATAEGTCGWGVGGGWECGLPPHAPGTPHWMVPTGGAA